MAVVIDDHLLLDLIAGIASPAAHEAVSNDAVDTTGCWYYRLALNMLNAEALAVALVAGADLRVAVASELPRDGAHDLQVGYQVLA